MNKLNIPADMFTWKPDEEDLKGLMKTFGVTKKEIAEALDIPLQRVTAALTGPRKGVYMQNPHVQSTRTLIMLYLNSRKDIQEDKTKEVWVRVGMTVKVTDDELYEIMDELDGEASDYEMPLGISKEWLDNAVVDGESYIPGVCLEEHLDWYKKEKEKRYASET